jgi:hypothetical protein
MLPLIAFAPLALAQIYRGPDYESARAIRPALLARGRPRRGGGARPSTDPVSQSQMLYRGLKRYNVPVEFVVYPREPHGLREQKHIVDRYKRSLDWVDKYLGAH